MSDNFDEIDDILNEVDAELGESVNEKVEAPVTEFHHDDSEKNFNEEELQDIMAEIETLEKDFEGEEVVAKSPEKIVAETTNVLSLDKKQTTKSKMNDSAPEISFEAHGQMKLNLGFKIGEESAKLIINPENGLVITLSGVELCINDKDGCKVTMENGVKFTIPLTSSSADSKKKSA